MATRQGLHTNLRAPTGEPLLDMLASTWAEAFKQAEDPDPAVAIPARAEIMSFFRYDRLTQLRERNLISWDPDRVPVQMMMEV